MMNVKKEQERRSQRFADLLKSRERYIAHQKKKLLEYDKRRGANR